MDEIKFQISRFMKQLLLQISFSYTLMPQVIFIINVINFNKKKTHGVIKQNKTMENSNSKVPLIIIRYQF